MPIATNRASQLAGGYAIELNGVSAGWVYSAAGGSAAADVVPEKIGPDRIVRKHIANVKYEDITIQCGTAMTKDFYDWIAATLELKLARMNGAIIITDDKNQPATRLEFYNGLITEVSFPALDASSNDPGMLTIKITPERTQYNRNPSFAGGGSIPLPVKLAPRWVCSNFRLQIAGLDCSKVAKIDSFTIRQAVVADAIGQLRDYEKVPTNLEIPNLAITLAESQADTFYDWHQDFVINGNNGRDKQKNGTLEILSPNLQDVIFRLTLNHLGIFRLRDDVHQASGNIRRVRAELFCEEMYFDASAASSGEGQKIAPATSDPAKTEDSRSRAPVPLVAPSGVPSAISPLSTPLAPSLPARDMTRSLRFRT